MSYTKQNFADGQVLKAEHLNHIEDGIIDTIKLIGGEEIIEEEVEVPSLLQMTRSNALVLEEDIIQERPSCEISMGSTTVKFIHVHDTAVDMDIIEDGCTIFMDTPNGIFEIPYDENVNIIGDLNTDNSAAIFISDLPIMAISMADNVTVTGDGNYDGMSITFPKKGIYFAVLSEDGTTLKTSKVEFGKDVFKSISINRDFMKWDNIVDAPFYTREGIVTDILFENIALSSSNIINDYNSFPENLFLEFHEDYEYVLVVDGVEYSNGIYNKISNGAEIQFNDVMINGNPAPINVQQYTNNTNTRIEHTQKGYGTYEINISMYTKHKGIVTRTLDMKYIPEELQVGEVVTSSNMLTWNGNPTGLYNVQNMIFHISDIIPTLADLQNGGTAHVFTATDTTEIEFTSENIIDTGSGIILIQLGSGEDGFMFAVVSHDNAVFTNGDDNITIEKAGIYFFSLGVYYMTGLTINGYTFKDVKRNTIDGKFLEPFEVVSGGSSDTLTWDGVVGDKVIVSVPESSYNFVHISDAIPTLNDLSNGGKISGYEGPTSLSKEFDSTTYMQDGSILVAAGLGENALFCPMIITEDNTSMDGIVFPKKGVYSIYIEMDGAKAYVSEFQINEYTGFGSGKDIAKLKEECMPPISSSNLGIFENGGTDTIYVADVSDEIRYTVDIYGNNMPLTRITDIVDMDIFQAAHVITDRFDGTRLLSYGLSSLSHPVYSWANGYDGFCDAMVIAEDYNFEGVPLKKGIYVLPNVKSLTVKGYKIFPKNSIKSDLINTDLQNSEGIMLTGDEAGGSDTLYNLGIDDPMTLLTSTVVPTMEELQKGVIIYGRVRSSGLELFEFPSETNIIEESSNGNISLKVKVDNDKYVTLVSIYSEGICFSRNKTLLESTNHYGCTEYMTIKGFNRFPMNGGKVINPKYLPESHQFGSVKYNYYGSAMIENGNLVYDGDTTGLICDNMDTSYLISDNVELFNYNDITIQVDNDNGNTLTFDGKVCSAMFKANDKFKAFETSNDMIQVFVVLEDNYNYNGIITFPKKGIYVPVGIYSNWVISVDGYEFKKETIKTINPKYIPSNTANATFTIESAAVGNINQATVTCDKTLSQLLASSLDELNNVRILWDVAGTGFIAKPISAQNLAGVAILIGFACLTITGLRFYYIAYNGDGITITEELPETTKG